MVGDDYMECKYCTSDDNRKPILLKETPLFDKTLTLNIHCEEWRNHLGVVVYTENGTIIYETSEIKYCPMCGRKLKEVE